MTDAARITVGDVDVAYRRDGSGPPLLYLHGSGLTRRWLPIYDELAARGFDVIVPEHPGYGDTKRPRWYRTLDDMALHVADLLTALGVDAADVVGHSFGGVLAGSFAAIFPERVRSLTLIAPGPLPVVSPPLEFDLPEDPEFEFDELLFNGNQDAYPEYRHADDEGEGVADDDGSDPHADPAAWEQWGAPALYRRLARVSAPAQILVADEDRLFGPEIFEAWARSLNCGIVPIPGKRFPTAHLLIVQEPGRIADAIRELAQSPS